MEGRQWRRIMSSGGKVITICLFIIMVLGIGLGKACTNNPVYDPTLAAKAEKIRIENELAVEKFETVRPALEFAAWGIAGLVLLAGSIAGYYGIRWVERRSRTIYPDRMGTMPVYVARPGDVIIDCGAMAGPVQIGTTAQYALPEEAVPRLQEGANQGAARTRIARAMAKNENRAPERGRPVEAYVLEGGTDLIER